MQRHTLQRDDISKHGESDGPRIPQPNLDYRQRPLAGLPLGVRSSTGADLDGCRWHGFTARYDEGILRRAAEFLRLSRVVDSLVQAILVPSMEGNIQRTRWGLVHLDIISQESAQDPWRPESPQNWARRMRKQSPLLRRGGRRATCSATGKRMAQPKPKAAKD